MSGQVVACDSIYVQPDRCFNLSLYRVIFLMNSENSFSRYSILMCYERCEVTLSGKYFSVVFSASVTLLLA